MKSKFKKVLHWLNHNSAITYFLVVTVLAAIILPNFGTLTNGKMILRQAAVPIIGATAMGFILVTGNIDLSMGYVVGFTSMLLGLCFEAGFPVWLAVIVCVLAGALFGVFNGGMVVLFKVPAFISTLGSGYIAYGLAQIISVAGEIRGFSPSYNQFAQFDIGGGIPIMILYAAVIVAIAFVVMNKTIFGRTLRSMGYNQDATTMSGLRTKPVLFFSFVIASALVAFTGVLSTIRVDVALPDLGGPTYPFEAVTACVLGGTSLYGGKSRIVGAAFGVLLVKEIANIITILRVSRYTYQAVLGIIILMAIVLESLKEKNVGFKLKENKQ